MSSALLLGATGLVGGECLSLLLEEPRYATVFAPSRRPLGAHPKLVGQSVDFETPPVLPAELAGGDVFCCLGTTIAKAGSPASFRRVDYDYVLALARRASERGMRQFVLVSSLGADPRSKLLYPRVKGEAERDIAALPFESVHLLRPSLLLGKRGESRPAEAAVQALAPLLSWVLVGPLRKYRPIGAVVVAKAMLRLAAQAAPGVQIIESDRLLTLGADAR